MSMILPDEDKTKEQLISELEEMRRRIALLEASEAEHESMIKWWENTLDSITDLVSIHDNNFRFIRLNRAVANLLKVKPEELIGKTCYEVFHGGNKPSTYCPHKKVLETKKQATQDFFEPHLGMYLQVSVSPIFNKSGEVSGTVHIIRDITKQNGVEEALRELGDRYGHLFEESPVGIGISSLDGKVLDGNEAMETITGYSIEELKSINLADTYVNPEDREPLLEAVSQQSRVVNCTVRLKRKDGTPYDALLNMSRVHLNGEDVVQTICIDLTEGKRAEEALWESEEKYRRLFEMSPIGILIVDMKGVITECNAAVYKEGGYSEDELVGKHFLKIAALRVRDIPQYIKMFGSVMRGKVPPPFEAAYTRKDGTIGWTEVHIGLFKAGGKKLGLQVLQRDLTEGKRAEEEEKRLQQELHLSRRLASLGELAAGIAHEINNPLTGILGFSQRLLKKSTSEEFSRDLAIIHGEAQRAARVVQNLLAFARRREPKKEYSNINGILQKALELRAYELKTSNIEVVTDLAPSLPEIMVDFPQIQEVFLNIILNAEQVMTEAHSDGRLTIKTKQIKDYIRISFVDDGPGIPPEHLDKVFDPFFTTRAEKGGTGLGLSACHGIVTEHGGRIYVKSKPKKGATFFVELPLSPIEATLMHRH